MAYLPPLVLIGPSSVGKSTLAQMLEMAGGYELLRSYTTRPRRTGEDDTTHLFVSDTEFDRLEAAGAFIGSTELFGHRYGLPRQLPEGQRPIILLRAPLVPLCRQFFPDCLVVQLSAPVATLIQRLAERSDHERAYSDNLAAELAAGEPLAQLVVDTTEPIESCTQRIIDWVDTRD